MMRNSTIKAGYYISPTDQIAILSELMNQAMFAQDAVVTITFTYLPSSSSIKHATPIWLDIGGCGSPDLPAVANTTFAYVSPAWESTVEGTVLKAGGHVHDGGTDIVILKNNQTISGCDLKAQYGQTPGYLDGPDTMSMGGMSGGGEMEYMGMHVSSISTCEGADIKKGDVLTIEALYDTTKYVPMIDTDGTLEDIMGISILYIV
jgi:hypothetical protein